MGMDFKRRLPNPQEIKQEMALGLLERAHKKQRDADIAAVMTGADPRKLLIIGPCSADREDAVVDYCTRLADLQQEVADKLILIPRLYTNKPRTLGIGYMGMLHQPNPNGEPNLLAGIRAIRHLNLRVIEETGLFGADEMLYPEYHRFISDLLSYVAVGARSVENQEHRLVASGLDVPVGMKNPPSGDDSVMLNAIVAAQAPHSFIYRNWDVESTGNPLAHAILRGYVGGDGRQHQNYSYDHLFDLVQAYGERNLANRAFIVDTNHANSNKRWAEQPRIAKDVLHSCSLNPDIAGIFRGFMIESYLEDGCQKVGGDVYGQSITDPCLGWEKTERLVREIAELV
ncbi:MAG: 3-deoxy-7-phosphoheptulonate synthase [Coriobacteriia bacterium]|nr:3-deoxy-7-phosphoheptulonate synthase [Coriobacteriia bacterium]MBS5478268.1 3-deoxy-7-phosphoheptulonate synthase [Coriobacteriia bacterium]